MFAEFIDGAMKKGCPPSKHAIDYHSHAQEQQVRVKFMQTPNSSRSLNLQQIVTRSNVNFSGFYHSGVSAYPPKALHKSPTTMLFITIQILFQSFSEYEKQASLEPRKLTAKAAKNRLSSKRCTTWKAQAFACDHWSLKAAARRG